MSDGGNAPERKLRAALTRALLQPVLCNITDPRQNRDGSKVGIASTFMLGAKTWRFGPQMAPVRAQQV
jgi:hypothetical protein